MIRVQIGEIMFWEASPPVRTRDETGRSVIGSELVDHQDEADERPVGGVATHVSVQFLRCRAWPTRSTSAFWMMSAENADGRIRGRIRFSGNTRIWLLIPHRRTR
jgi:hypothetical protein